MPLYNLACASTPDERESERIAQAVTRAHCDVTGAPATFVNVMFAHGYPLVSGLSISALGGVRIGGNRTPEVIERLRLALRDGIATAAGLATAQVQVVLIGVPYDWTMEGGDVMPPPGAEQEWLERHHR
ncbi:MAG TPA: 4-oxalocrotonate tautomerase [Verrucomicrobiae bacterium]|nr:4-oxalocrotonate tautomerase [Verrucomicrobiae bacterium]